MPRTAKPYCRTTCIITARCDTLESESDVKNLVTILLLARRYFFARAVIEKPYLFHMTLDEDAFYMKIVALNEINKFLVLSFCFHLKSLKCLKI